MGNIQRWGGPLTKNWIKDEWEINLKITERQKEFGMYQVYPAFAGFVPDCIKEIYPNATVRTATAWGDFDPKYTSNTMIDPEDPLFKTIAKLFIETIKYVLSFFSHLLARNSTTLLTTTTPISSMRWIYPFFDEISHSHGVSFMTVPQVY